MKKYLFFLIAISLLAKELPPGYTYSNSNTNVVNNYNRWQDEITDLQLKDNYKTLKLIQLQGLIEDEILKQRYKEAEYRLSTERESLKNDLIRAKIYWYYHNNYRRYYYFDFNWNIIYLN